MNKNDLIRKYSSSPYIIPEYYELYTFNERDIKNYCNWVNTNYASIVKTWDVEKNTYWTAKYYLATKFLFITNLLLHSYIFAKAKNLKIVLPYLIYYSLLTASRSLILTSPIDKAEIASKRNHTEIINITADIIAKINIKKVKNIRILSTLQKIIENCFHINSLLQDFN